MWQNKRGRICSISFSFWRPHVLIAIDRLGVLCGMFMKLAMIIFAAVILILSSGCIETYQEIRIKSNLSGEMHLRVVYHVESIVKATAMMQQQQQQPEAGAPQEMPEEQKMMMLESIKSMLLTQSEEQKNEIESKLPEGIKIQTFEVNETEANIVEMKVVLAFSHIDDLKALKQMEEEAAANKRPGKQDNKQNPFEGFSIESQPNGTIIIKQNMEGKTSELKKMPVGGNKDKPKNKKEAAAMAELENMMKSLMEGMGVHFRVRVPYMKYNVGKHNAREYDKKNHTLRWDYTGERIMKMAQEGKAPESIYVELIPKK